VGIPEAADRPAPQRTRMRLEECKYLPKELISASEAKVGVSVEGVGNMVEVVGGDF